MGTVPGGGGEGGDKEVGTGGGERAPPPGPLEKFAPPRALAEAEAAGLGTPDRYLELNVVAERAQARPPDPGTTPRAPKLSWCSRPAHI